MPLRNAFRQGLKQATSSVSFTSVVRYETAPGFWCRRWSRGAWPPFSTDEGKVGRPTFATPLAATGSKHKEGAWDEAEAPKHAALPE